MPEKIVPLAMRNPGYLNNFGPMKLDLEVRAHHEFLHLKVSENILTKIRPLGLRSIMVEDLYYTPGIEPQLVKV